MFAKFGELAWFTVALIAVAVLGGIFALIKRDNAKKIMAATGIAALVIIIAAIVTFLVKGTGTEAFSGVDMSSAAFTVLIVLLIAVMFALLVISGRKVKWTAHDIAYATICVAMSFILSCIKLYSLPQGGSITPAQFLPIVLYISVAGPLRGVVVGFAYGLLQLLQGAYVINPLQLIVDYPLAFGAFALAGVVKYIKMPEYFKLPVAVILGYFARFVMAAVSGAVFFAEYAGDLNPWIYSIGYNAAYIGPDCAACVVVSLIPIVNGIRKKLMSR